MFMAKREKEKKSHSNIVFLYGNTCYYNLNRLTDLPLRAYNTNIITYTIIGILYIVLL